MNRKVWISQMSRKCKTVVAISTIFEDKDDSGGQDTDKLPESDSNHKLRLRTLLITISPLLPTPMMMQGGRSVDTLAASPVRERLDEFGRNCLGSSLCRVLTSRVALV
ncbi:hypothetical protein PI125_g2995 [Phytophthora idaei]|nr:hypothetical protein PI125_g2995 [Phytophthora idaei]KAG3155765.1 hypothetical protein PI126_g9047 [Phytophthora idaei]